MPVPYPVTEYIGVPAELTMQRNKITLPEELTYGEALEHWAIDRATIDTLNGQLRAIQSLENPSPEIPVEE